MKLSVALWGVWLHLDPFFSVVGGEFVAVFSVILVIIQLRVLGFRGALKVSQSRTENPLKPLI